MKSDSRVVELKKQGVSASTDLFTPSSRECWAHFAGKHRSVEGEVVVLRVERLVGVLELEVRREGVLPSEDEWDDGRSVG